MAAIESYSAFFKIELTAADLIVTIRLLLNICVNCGKLYFCDGNALICSIVRGGTISVYFNITQSFIPCNEAVRSVFLGCPKNSGAH